MASYGGHRGRARAGDLAQGGAEVVDRVLPLGERRGSSGTMSAWRVGWVVAASTLVLAGCGGSHAATPTRAPDDASGGHAPPGFDTAIACADWRTAAGRYEDAARHDSFPELDPRRSCFVPVRYGL